MFKIKSYVVGRRGSIGPPSWSYGHSCGPRCRNRTRFSLFDADGSPLRDSPTTTDDWSRDNLYVTSSAHTDRVNQTFAYNFISARF